MSDDETIYCSFVSIDYIICECGETFPSEDDLRVHLEKEHPQKRERKEYKCGICEQVYPTSEECINHYEQAHIDIKLEHNYVVDPDTLDDYKDERDLRYGQNTVQETYEVNSEPLGIDVDDWKKFKVWTDRANKKGTVCEICGKKYASNAALRYHQRVHTGERPYRCSMCTKTFTMPLFLKIHERTHTGERPYECSRCPKAFNNKAALLRHDRVHTGVKPYACPKCGKTFTQSNSMKLHVNTVHLKMPAPYKSQKRRLREKIKNECAEGSVKEECVRGSVKEECLRGSVKEECVIMEECVDMQNNNDISYFVVHNEDSVTRSDMTYFCKGQDGVTYTLVYN